MKVNHKRIFASSFRTAILFIVSIILYDLLREVDKLWYKDTYNKMKNFTKRKIILFIMLFLLDCALLYAIFHILDLEL